MKNFDRWDSLIPSVNGSHALDGLTSEPDLNSSTAHADEMLASGFMCQLPTDIVRCNAKDIDSVARQGMVLEEISGPPISKAWEDSYLKEANEEIGERCCVAAKRDMCQGILMAARTTFQSVVGRPMKEFLLPSQYKTFDETGALPAIHGFCLVCTRYLCTEALTRRGMLHVGKFRGNLCPFAVRVDVPGEYDSRVCMYTNDPRTGCDRPFVQHADNRYMYRTDPTGLQFLEQVQVSYVQPSKNDRVTLQDRHGFSARVGWPSNQAAK
jgi:hypothetical protein